MQDVFETLSNALHVLVCYKSSKIDSGCIYDGIFSEENPGDGGKSFPLTEHTVLKRFLGKLYNNHNLFQTTLFNTLVNMNKFQP